MEYVFVLRGRLGGLLQDALHPVAVMPRANSTAITLDIKDDAQLYGALARLERLGVSIVSIEPADGQADLVK